MDKATVLKTARLARLKLDEARADALAESLGRVFKLVEKLDEVDVKDVKPMTSVINHAAYRRPDVVNDGHKQADVTTNAPDSSEGFFVVPKVVE